MKQLSSVRQEDAEANTATHFRRSSQLTEFSKLLKEVRGCRICAANLPEGPRPVLQIHPEARILIAGQAPGRRVHASGVPFDDPSGVRLREWLGVDTDTFYDPRFIAILPMGFCYPGTGKSGDLPPRPECAPAWREAILSHLTKLRLTLVLGRYAQAYHLGEKTRPLTEVVREWRTHWPDTLPLPHPSPRNQVWFKRNPWFDEEVIPALRQRVDDLRSEAARSTAETVDPLESGH